MTPRLIGLSLEISGCTFYLDELVTSVGRDCSNNIELNDPLISRHHCLVRREGGVYIIEDLNSTNGVYVDGVRVKMSPLREGTLIYIGNSLFIFWLQEFDESISLNPSQVGGESNCKGITLCSNE